jgi:peptidoglycan-N-acetylglucosamine deacetylase
MTGWLRVVPCLLVLAGLFGFASRGPADEGSRLPAAPSPPDREPTAFATPGEFGFGSENLLNSCWSPEELLEQPGDRPISKPSHPHGSQPPARTTPVHLLPRLAPELRNVIRQVNPVDGRKVIALTFDLCEAAGEISGYDREVVDYLRRNSVKATFFAGGKWMRSHPERTLQIMADPLFELGNHSWSHRDFRTSTPEQMEQQILWTQAQYELLREELRSRPCAQRRASIQMEKIPKAPRLFRFPYGACSAEALQIVAQNGLPVIQWDVVTGDPARTQTAEGIARVVLRKTRPGSIIICHANGRGHGTARALPLLVPELRTLGYEFVTVSELLAGGAPVSTAQCDESAAKYRPGAPKRPAKNGE